MIIFNWLLPVAINIVKMYVKSTESKKDDKVLEVAKELTEYLSVKDNNTLNVYTSDIVSKAVMK